MNDVAAKRRTQQDTGPELGRIATERRGHLFLIGIDRPAKYNGFTPKMCRELAQAYADYEADDGLRCAVLHAAGDHFTAGLELSAFDISRSRTSSRATWSIRSTCARPTGASRSSRRSRASASPSASS